MMVYYNANGISYRVANPLRVYVFERLRLCALDRVSRRKLGMGILIFVCECVLAFFSVFLFSSRDLCLVF
jgi:hypothetical protein